MLKFNTKYEPLDDCMLFRFNNYFKFFNDKSVELKFYVIIIMIALLIDMEMSNEAHLIGKHISNDYGEIVFILVSFVYLLSQQYIVGQSTNRSIQYHIETRSFRIIQRITNFMIFSIMLCFLTIILEILFSESYHSIFLLVVLVITNTITVIVMSNISIKFFSWYRNRRQLQILIFGIMSSTIAITAVVTILFMGAILVRQPEKIDSDFDVLLPNVAGSPIASVLNYSYYYLAIFSFIITWIITALMLKDYSKKLGQIKYSLILLMPLLFYLSQLLITQFGLFIPEEESDQFSFQIWFSFIYTLSSPIGGILFSLPFFLIIRKIITSEALQNFLKISAYGFILFFAAGSATVYHTPYPPFGLSTVGIIGPSSYLIAIGIYYSVRLIAKNRAIENQLKRSDGYSQFFASVGSAEMEKTMVNLVETIRKKLPPDKDDSPEDSELIAKEIIEYLKKYHDKKNDKN